MTAWQYQQLIVPSRLRPAYNTRTRIATLSFLRDLINGFAPPSLRDIYLLELPPVQEFDLWERLPLFAISADGNTFMLGFYGDEEPLLTFEVDDDS